MMSGNPIDDVERYAPQKRKADKDFRASRYRHFTATSAPGKRTTNRKALDASESVQEMGYSISKGIIGSCIQNWLQSGYKINAHLRSDIGNNIAGSRRREKLYRIQHQTHDEG